MKRPLQPSIRIAVGILAFLACVLLAVTESSAEEPRLTASPGAFRFASVKEPLFWEQALDLALWASDGGKGSEGVKSEENPTEAIRGAIRGGIIEMLALPAWLEITDEGEKAAFVLEFMHKRYLVAYSERQTRLDTLIRTGRFNCVSSASLYLIFGAAAGLDVAGVMTKDHAFCSVVSDGLRVDVETTSPYGYDPGSRKEFQDSFGRATGFAYVPPKNYRDRTPIGQKELLSLILSNRIVDLESSGTFYQAVGLALDRWVLLGTPEGSVFEDLIIRMVNYAASLAKAGKEIAALDWSVRAIEAFGPHARWDELVGSASNNLLVGLIRKRRISDARSELERLRPGLTVRAARDLDFLVGDAELTVAAEESDFASALLTVASAKVAGIPDPTRIREIEVYVWLKESGRIAQAEGWASAIAAAERATTVVGPDRRIADALRVYRNNRMAELHNTFVAFYNAGRYQEAKEAAVAALYEFPGEARLKADLNSAEKALLR